MMQALNCFEPAERQNDFVLCMSRLIPYEKLQDISNENLHKDKLNLHGTLIVQLMLEFNKPIKVVNSILNMQTEDVKKLFSNSMGSHVVDSYAKGGFVGEKSREKLVKKLQVKYGFELFCLSFICRHFLGMLSRFSCYKVWFKGFRCTVEYN